MKYDKIIKTVKEIILKYCNPERIYLYGSRANNTSNKTSDIDIAYEDKDCQKHFLILEEIEKIDTLLKIDVKNIANTDKRFYNRVKDTGKVLYSATKKLRAEDGIYNFANALNKFTEVVDKEEFYKNEGFGDIYLDLLVKRFEFTYEMAWKAIKRYLDFLGIEVINPRSAFKEAYAQQLIEDEDIWLEMIEQRNLSSHIYDENEISEILDKKDDFKIAFQKLKEVLSNSL